MESWSEEYQVGEILELRKPHPCGGRLWTVVRLGADIGLVCQTCGHKVFISRRELSGRIKSRKSGENMEKDHADNGTELC